MLLEIPSSNTNSAATAASPTPTTTLAVTSTTGVSARRLFRTFFLPHLRAFQVPVNVVLPTTIDVKKWAEQDAEDAELVAQTQRVQIGPVTEEERTHFAAQGVLRHALHFSLFRQLATLIITKQKLDATDLDLPLQLQYLDLSHNCFRVVPTAVVKLQHLKVLRMESNYLRQVRSVTSLPSGLRELHLADNSMLASVDLSHMSALALVDLMRADKSIELVNVASAARSVFVDSSPSMRWVFHHLSDTEPQGMTPQSTLVPQSQSQALEECARKVKQLRHERPLARSQAAERSARQMNAFLRAAIDATLLEEKYQLPNHAKKRRADAESLCAFRVFFPSFDAISEDRAKRDKWSQFVAFVRFCYYNECFLDWDALQHPSPDSASMFVASRYILDLRGIFPSANSMHASLANAKDNDALFQTVMLEQFSNFAHLQVEQAQAERDRAAETSRAETHRLLLDDLRATMTTTGLQSSTLRDKIEKLVQYEIGSQSQTAH